MFKVVYSKGNEYDIIRFADQENIIRANTECDSDNYNFLDKLYISASAASVPKLAQAP